jgi:hypothetical protein
MIALCEYELAPPFAKAASRQGLVAIRVHDSTADYTDSQRGVAAVDPVTYAFGIGRACSRDRIVVLKRLHRSLAAGCCCGEQAARCLRTHPYLDPPHLRSRDAGISPSAAFAPSPPEPQPTRMIATPAMSASRAIPAEG